jgi:hypothetical protein
VWITMILRIQFFFLKLRLQNRLNLELSCNLW